MFTKTSTQKSWKAMTAIGFLLMTAMGATAFASKGLIQDRRVTLTQAQAMATKAESDSGFPIVVNELVLKQLNRYMGTPEGREFMRNSLERMQNYKTGIAEILKKYGVPEEILAVPLIESGYKNMTEQDSNTPAKAAGLWQFIPSTARVFEMTVDDQRDDRLDVPVETDAAARYLQSNRLRFNDWQLSVLAYNMGEKAVQQAIDATGSRDVWYLIRHGYEGDRDYLAKLMAAILIMKNPETLN